MEGTVSRYLANEFPRPYHRAWMHPGVGTGFFMPTATNGKQQDACVLYTGCSKPTVAMEKGSYWEKGFKVDVFSSKSAGKQPAERSGGCSSSVLPAPLSFGRRVLWSQPP